MLYLSCSKPVFSKVIHNFALILLLPLRSYSNSSQYKQEGGPSKIGDNSLKIRVLIFSFFTVKPCFLLSCAGLCPVFPSSLPCFFFSSVSNFFLYYPEDTFVSHSVVSPRAAYAFRLPVCFPRSLFFFSLDGCGPFSIRFVFGVRFCTLQKRVA